MSYLFKQHLNYIFFFKAIIMDFLETLLLCLEYGIHRVNGQFFECPGKMFLNIEKVLEKISEDQPFLILYASCESKVEHLSVPLLC